MTSPDLPAELKAALDGRLRGFSRNDAATRAASISKTYRDGGGSGAIRSETDALAYALARMPATYAAVAASLNALCEIRPDFAPASLLDVGAGPGTATWAAAEAFPSLQGFALLDANDALRALALNLFSDSFRLREVGYELGEARSALAKADAADLVIASYMIGEIGAAEQKALAGLMWQKTGDTLLVVEPGTPAGYARIIALREPVEVALAEVKMIEKLGVRIQTGVELGVDIQLAELQQQFEMVVLSVGLGQTPLLGIPGEEHLFDGLEYVERSRVASEPLAIGRHVLVIGAGNTAIDCATIARRQLPRALRADRRISRRPAPCRDVSRAKEFSHRGPCRAGHLSN